MSIEGEYEQDKKTHYIFLTIPHTKIFLFRKCSNARNFFFGIIDFKCGLPLCSGLKIAENPVKKEEVVSYFFSNAKKITIQL